MGLGDECCDGAVDVPDCTCMAGLSVCCGESGSSDSSSMGVASVSPVVAVPCISGGEIAEAACCGMTGLAD